MVSVGANKKCHQGCNKWQNLVKELWDIDPALVWVAAPYKLRFGEKRISKISRLSAAFIPVLDDDDVHKVYEWWNPFRHGGNKMKEPSENVPKRRRRTGGSGSGGAQGDGNGGGDVPTDEDDGDVACPGVLDAGADDDSADEPTDEHDKAMEDPPWPF